MCVYTNSHEQIHIHTCLLLLLDYLDNQWKYKESKQLHSVRMLVLSQYHQGSGHRPLLL